MLVPLHTRSAYSFGCGTASVDELVDRAAELGYHALALTDLENLCGQVRFHDRCRSRGIRPLTGIELRPGFDPRGDCGSRRGRMVLLAENGAGYRSLCRIVARRRGAVRDTGETILDDGLLGLAESHSAGLFALSDDPAVVERLLEGGRFSRERLGVLLVRPDRPEADRERRSAALRLGVSLVADLNVYILRPEDHDLLALLLAVRRQIPLKAVLRSGIPESPGHYLRSPQEAQDLFADRPDAVSAAARIAEACRVDLSSEVAKALSRDPSETASEVERLRSLCRESLAERSARSRPWSLEHAGRLERELETVAALGFSGLILNLAEILRYCRGENIPAALRGSAAGSLLLHLLGASPIDPLGHGLLFERFLHRSKSSWPDIDLDLPWHRRDEVIAWAARHFGSRRTAVVSAHHTFGLRAALREGLKACGARPEAIETLLARLPPEDLREEESDLLPTGALPELLPLVRRLVGRPRHLAAHPGGLLIGRSPLDDFLPLQQAAKGMTITQYDALSVARLGLVKLDLLGNRCLSEVAEALELAGHPRPCRLETIPDDDPATLALIDRADTLGCFQLESPAMRSLLARLPIRKQSDLVAALALIRPGAAAGEAKAAFVRRARGEEPAECSFPQMAQRLEETHGLLLYEEDIMLLLAKTGGLSLAEADELRSAIVKSGGTEAALAELESGFLEAADNQGTHRSSARRAWQAAARFAAYSFNKAHAVSYGRLAYLSAYTRAHHPLPFACALLNHHQGLYPLRTLAAEFVRMGVELRVPHVNASDYRTIIERDPTGERIRVGLDKVKGLSRRATADLLTQRGRRPFADLPDLLERVRLSRGELSALLLAGACDGLPPLQASDYPFAHKAALEHLRQGKSVQGLLAIPIPRPTAEDERTRLYRSLSRIRNELRLLEMAVSAHSMALLRPEANRFGCRTIREAVRSEEGEEMHLAVLVGAMRRVRTEGGVLQFLTLEDETGLMEAVVLPATYRRLGERVVTPGPFLVEGVLIRRQDVPHLEVTRLEPFHERRRRPG